LEPVPVSPPAYDLPALDQAMVLEPELFTRPGLGVGLI